ncbi:MAG: ABC transporter ATP-binding protein [Sporichthyaceae bacterium]
MTAPVRGPAPPGGFGPGGRGHGPAGPALLAAMPAEKSLRFGTSTLRLLRMLRPQWFLVGTAVLAGVLSIALNVLGPRLLGHATDLIVAGIVGQDLPAGLTRDQALEQLNSGGRDDLADLVRNVEVTISQGVDFGALGAVLAGVLAIYLGSFVFYLVQGRCASLAVQRLVFRLREESQDKITRLPLSYLDAHSRGELLSRVTNDIDNIAQTLQQTLSQLLNALLMIVGVLAMMFWISPLLGSVVLITVPISIWLAKAIGQRSQPQFVTQWASTGKLNGHIEEMYTGHALVRAFGRTPDATATFTEHNEALYAASFRAQFISGVIAPAMMFVGNLGYVFVAVIGGLRVASGSLSLGEVQAFIQYTRQFSHPVTQAASMANLLQSGVASAERVFDLLDAREQSPEPAAQPDVIPVRAGPRGAVEFTGVSFRYERDRPLIEDLSLSVAAGATVAIVGPTGAGKTTLVNLLMRFYDVDSGSISIDGVDISTMPRPQVRAGLGMVLQDTWLFGGTIADNVAYGRPDASREDVIAAARATHAEHFIRTLPDGYDTVLDGDAADLSAGERQLLTIARAYLSDPAILILDEATSFVDTRTEALIQRGSSTLAAGRTCFVIAHRLSTIRDADVILVMESGRIVEQGNHGSLLAAGGAYARLYAAQFAAAPADGAP